jgi:hypothetical protein
MSRTYTIICMLVCTTLLYEFMNLHRNDVYNLFINTHVRTKIYRGFVDKLKMPSHVSNVIASLSSYRCRKNNINIKVSGILLLHAFPLLTSTSKHKFVPCKLHHWRTTNYKCQSIDGCLKYYFGKNYMSRTNTIICMLVCTTLLYEFMNLHRNDVYNLFVNTHVRTKIYRGFNHGIIYIVNDGRHIRIKK